MLEGPPETYPRHGDPGSTGQDLEARCAIGLADYFFGRRPNQPKDRQDGSDAYMEVETGTYHPNDPSTRTWNEQKFTWSGNQLVSVWNFASDWQSVKLAPLGGWEPVFPWCAFRQLCICSRGWGLRVSAK